jgi:outer membrane protein
MILSFSKILFGALLLSCAVSPVSAETLQGALAKAYKFNSSLNSARAGVRATDENVPLAKSGYRPTIAGQADIDHTSTTTRIGGTQIGSRITTGSFGVQINQMLFDGFQTRNNVSAAEAGVRAAREGLRNTEQNTLFNAASAYMDVIRDRQIAALTERNLAFLNEQVRAARSRFDVGEGTRTDVAQAEAQHASATAQLSGARAQIMASAGAYRQYIGEDPGKLAAAKPANGLPKSFEAALAVAREQHPAILAGEHQIDVAQFTVKSSEGALLPGLDASAGLSTSARHTHTAPSLTDTDGISTTHTNSASIGATLTIPIYTGGRASANIRQKKELLGQARINLDVSRDQVRQALTSAWSAYKAAREGVQAGRTLVNAQQLALNGVVEERNVGQRTTLDVLNAQAAVIQAQINLASDEHDVVVASYAILNAMGKLSPEHLGLGVSKYEPKEHYEAVKDKWYGLRTPDGR